MTEDLRARAETVQHWLEQEGEDIGAQCVRDLLAEVVALQQEAEKFCEAREEEHDRAETADAEREALRVELFKACGEWRTETMLREAAEAQLQALRDAFAAHAVQCPQCHDAVVATLTQPGAASPEKCMLCGEPREAHTKKKADWRDVPGCTGLYSPPGAASEDSK